MSKQAKQPDVPRVYIFRGRHWDSSLLSDRPVEVVILDEVSDGGEGDLSFEGAQWWACSPEQSTVDAKLSAKVAKLVRKADGGAA